MKLSKANIASIERIIQKARTAYIEDWKIKEVMVKRVSEKYNIKRADSISILSLLLNKELIAEDSITTINKIQNIKEIPIPKKVSNVKTFFKKALIDSVVLTILCGSSYLQHEGTYYFLAKNSIKIMIS